MSNESLDLATIESQQAAIYEPGLTYDERAERATSFIDRGLVDDLIAEVKRLRKLLALAETQSLGGDCACPPEYVSDAEPHYCLNCGKWKDES